MTSNQPMEGAKFQQLVDHLVEAERHLSYVRRELEAMVTEGGKKVVVIKERTTPKEVFATLYLPEQFPVLHDDLLKSFELARIPKPEEQISDLLRHGDIFESKPGEYRPVGHPRKWSHQP